MKSFLILSLISLAAHSESASYCLDIITKDTVTNQPLAEHAHCQVNEHLTTNLSSSFWQCQFNDNDKIVKFEFSPYKVGFNYDLNKAYVVQLLAPHAKLGDFLFSNLNLSIETVKSPELVIYYDSKLTTSSNEFILKTHNDYIKLIFSNFTYLKSDSCF